MNIGIIGLGFVGSAINNYLSKQNVNIFTYDKYKNINSFNNILKTYILYICLPTLYCANKKTYDMDEIDKTIELLANNKYKGIVLIKSTILPSYCSMINNLYPKLTIIHNPEFLTARTAVEDFANQRNIILGYTSQSKYIISTLEIFFKELFPTAIISSVTSEEAGLCKLACNSFYATKIQYFTEIYLLCEKLNISYDNVKNLMLANNWINPMHTNIPGHDNMISFGGACFPKDISALNQLMNSSDSSNKVVEAVITERNLMREL